MKNTASPDNQTKAATTIWNAGFISIFIANAMMNMSQQMMNSLVAKYANYMGAPATIVGLVVSMFAVTALLFKVISGPAIDAFDRRIVLTIAMCIMACAYFGYSLSHNVPMLIISRLLQGCGQAFTATCCLALASDTLPPEKFASGIGIFSMAQAAAQAIGPTIALSLVDLLGYNITFTIGGCIMLMAACLAFRVKTAPRPRSKFKISLDHIAAKEAALPAAIIFFLAMAFSVINSFLIIYAGERGVEGIGLYFTVYAGTLLFTRPFVGRMSDKFGAVKVMIPAMCCFAASFYMISCSTSLWMFLLAGFIAAFGYGACNPLVQTLCMKCVPASRRGAGSNTNYIGNDLGQMMGPVISGMLVESFGYVSMWRMMTIPMGVAVLLTFCNRGRINTAEEEFRKRESA